MCAVPRSRGANPHWARSEAWISRRVASTIATAVLAYSDALAVSDTENTRTKITVAAKDDARNAAEQMCRKYAILIKANSGISDPDKIAAGVRPANTSREPILVPDTSPALLSQQN